MKQKKSRRGTRRLKRRTPGGRSVVHCDKRRPSHAECARCSGKLAGVPRATPCNLGKMTKSERSVSRKFGGVLCSRCVRDSEKYRARMESGFAVKRDLTIEKFLPSGWYRALGIKARVTKKEAKIPETVEEAEKVAEEVAKEVEATMAAMEESKAEKPKKKAKALEEGEPKANPKKKSKAKE